MPDIPDDQFIRITNVIHMTSLSRAQIYLMERGGEFPRRIPFTATMFMWTSRHVRAWMQERLQARKAHAGFPHVKTIELDDRFINKKQLLKLVPLCEKTILFEERGGRFPTRLRVSRTRIAWLEREVVLWRESKLAAQTAAEHSCIEVITPVARPLGTAAN